MNRLSLAIFACCSPFLYAQTNLPSSPMPTMGDQQAYSVVCKSCTREQVLIPLSTKVVTTESNQMGELQKLELTFKCVGPKCGKKFTWTTPRWIRAPMQLAPASQLKLTPTNAPSPLKPPAQRVISPKDQP